MKPVASVRVTLDGVMGAPEEWAHEFVDEESERLGGDDLLAADALLMGRVTYEGFLGYWPSATDPEAERMNGLRKYVVSNSLQALEWNNSTLIAGDVAGQVQALKDEPGRDLLLLASADLANSLRAENLIDESRDRMRPARLCCIDPLVSASPTSPSRCATPSTKPHAPDETWGAPKSHVQRRS